MTTGATGAPSGSKGFAAYPRETVERFFAEAVRERARLLSEMATARRRIADARAALAEAVEVESACIAAVLDAQRALREERRANERAIAAVHASAEAEAERILQNARARADADTSVRPATLHASSNGYHPDPGAHLGEESRPWVPHGDV